jgi:hypothetical protein
LGIVRASSTSAAVGALWSHHCRNHGDEMGSETFKRLKEQFGQPLYVEAEQVNTAFFPHLTRAKFFQKIDRLEITLVPITFHDSQKAQKYFRLDDVAAYLDEREKQARYVYEKTAEILRAIGAFLGVGLSGHILLQATGMIP